MNSKVFSSFQKVGPALMTPVAALPIAALLLRLGVLWNIDIVTAAGAAIFDNLALIFAIGVAFGLAKNNHGAAALAGAISYLVITRVAPAAAVSFGVVEEAYVLNNNVLAGMISGMIGGLMYNKYYNIKLPEWLGFFAGKRFVPIVTSVFTIFVGMLFGVLWPIIEKIIGGTGEWMMASGSVGAFFFGLLNRLLIPTGLHHVINSFVWFVFGEYNGATGDLSRFFAGDPTAGTYMTGFFPVMMFGLPAVALAMYTTAKKQNRKAVGGLMFSVAFTAFLTGITEPLEFMFMFLAPVLYGVHAVLTGVSMAVCHMLGLLHGFGFSAGFIDYVVNFNLATKPVLLVGVGLVFGVIYYVIFVFIIKKLDLPTPGRMDDETGNEELLAEKGVSYIAKEYLRVLGGKDNIQEINACITRLRLTLKNNDLVKEEDCKALGASGIIKPNKYNIQVIVGTKAELIADEIKNLL
ncbi:MAG: PTS sugar transporter [Firmicutes bacterium HGW-Firmicutes-1]|nr:MAG: PTS sugar transporter [Firmicutes bacterium HGW-Firmicutes-1]